MSNISFVSSEIWKGIQNADLIAWCIFQAFENNNPRFLDRIKEDNTIIIHEK